VSVASIVHSISNQLFLFFLLNAPILHSFRFPVPSTINFQSKNLAARDDDDPNRPQ
jgi:hypothetical protein